MPAKTITPEQFDKLHAYYLAHPAEFVTDILGSKPWNKQVEIIDSVFTYKLTAVKTCNAIGKSYIAARIVLAFLMLHPHSIVVTTAPTWRQVTDILWREIGTALKKSKYKLTDKEATQAGLNLNTDWYAVGLSTAKPENFFGYHADHILVVVDEAGGVDEAIFKGVAAITPNINSRILYIGNPTDPTGTFYDVFNKPELGANCITVSAFDTPNFTSTGLVTVEDLLKAYTPPQGVKQMDWSKQVDATLASKLDPVYTGLISPSVVYGRYHEWGPDSSAWQSLIMGEFPNQAEQSLIPVNLVRMAMSMHNIDKETGKTIQELSGWDIPDGPPAYGQDMARFGNDLNVNTPRRGGWVENQIVWNKKGDAKLDLVESAEMIVNIIDPLNSSVRVNIDDTGNGGGTTDSLRHMSRQSMANNLPSHQYQIVDYNFSRSPQNPDKFHDITSEMYWNLRTWFYNKKIGMYFDQQLFDELVGRRWMITPQKKIKVESKEEYKKRTGGKSPDRSDSLALAFAGSDPNRPPDAQQDMTRDQKREETVRRTMAPVTGGLQSRY